MIKLILNRTYMEYRTVGILCSQEHPICVTLERPWLGNESGMSCIPEGDYLCKKYDSTRFINTFQVMDVPKRSKILFHKGNYVHDSTGCILLGTRFAMTKEGDPMVSHSAQAMRVFIGYLGGDREFKLRIVGC